MKTNRASKTFAVVGHPVAHSHSPRLFNTIFENERINATYTAIDGENMEELIKMMFSQKISGYSVTIPHKEKAFTLVDRVDDLAQKTQAINTIVLRDKLLWGYNYDGLAALDCLTNAVRDWRERDVILLGAGGAARGIALAMLTQFSFQKKLNIAVRSVEKAQNLATALRLFSPKVAVISLDEVKKKQWQKEIIINTTPVGMNHQHPTSLLESKHFSAESVAYDIIYTPPQTLFLQQAEKAGAKTINGLGMFLGQARRQLETFTGLRLSHEQMFDYYEQSKKQ